MTSLRISKSQVVSALAVIISVASALAGVAHQISPAHAMQIMSVCTVTVSLCRSLLGGLSGQSPAPSTAPTAPTAAAPSIPVNPPDDASPDDGTPDDAGGLPPAA